MTHHPLNRRDVVTLIGGAAAAPMLWPLAARAQQPVMPRVGALMSVREIDPEGRERVAAFQQGLKDLGWTDGRNVRIDYRWGNGSAAQARSLAKELVGLAPDVLLAQGTPALQAVAQATRSIPIVFTTVSDPVGDGFVASLAHPGGNITGFSNYEYTIGGKWLGLLKEIAPAIARVAVILNVDNPASAEHLHTIESVSPSFGVVVTPLRLRETTAVERAIDEFAAAPNGGLLVLPGYASRLSREAILRLAARHRLPAIYPGRVDATSGGLMSYGVDTIYQHKRAALYVNRILKGEKPADLPVEQPTKYTLVINLKTAKALGLDVPPTFSARADEVIE